MLSAGTSHDDALIAWLNSNSLEMNRTLPAAALAPLPAELGTEECLEPSMAELDSAFAAV